MNLMWHLLREGTIILSRLLRKEEELAKRKEVLERVFQTEGMACAKERRCDTM